jgi:hypothetical protein
VKGKKIVAGMLILLIGLSIITDVRAQELDKEAKEKQARINMNFDIVSELMTDFISDFPFLAPLAICVYIPIMCHYIISLLRLVKPQA